MKKVQRKQKPNMNVQRLFLVQHVNYFCSSQRCMLYEIKSMWEKIVALQELKEIVRNRQLTSNVMRNTSNEK